MKIKFINDFIDLEGTIINTKEELLEYIKNNQTKSDFVCETYKDLVEFEQWVIDITYAEPTKYERRTKKFVEKSIKEFIQTLKFPDLEFIKSLYSKSIKELQELSFIQVENPVSKPNEYTFIDHYLVIKHLEANLDLETSLNEYCRDMLVDLSFPIEIIILSANTSYTDIIYNGKDFTIDTLVLIDFSSKVDSIIDIDDSFCIHYVFQRDWNNNAPRVNYYSREYTDRDYSMFYTIKVKNAK